MHKTKLKQIGIYIFLGFLIPILALAISGGLRNVFAQTGDCIIDVDGPNDVPVQKDLTKFCTISIDPDILEISWNWDEILLTGANTADGCAIFDSDDDGLVNFALCTSWNLDQQYLGTILYTCDDDKPLNCTNATEVEGAASSCEIENDPNPGDGDDPFPGDVPESGDPVGDEWPDDTQAFCTIYWSDVGGTQTEFLDVCSYPSGLDSSASDCVATSISLGNLEIIKHVVPDDANTAWDILVTNPGVAVFSDTLIGDDTTGNIAILANTYTITETGGTETTISHYASSWKCVETTDPTTLSGEGTTIHDLSIAKGEIWKCTFTNESLVDVTIEKTDYDFTRTDPYPTYPFRGAALPYKITVTSTGGLAKNVSVTDDLDLNINASSPSFTISLATDPDGTTRTCSYSEFDHEITCDLGNMAKDEVVTIEFDVIVGDLAPLEGLVETGECIQGDPNLQGTKTVDICNIVSVTADNETDENTADNTTSEPTDIGIPTAVDLLYFTSKSLGDAIQLDWETASEVDNLGFYLYRSITPVKPQEPLTDLIPSQSPGGMEGAVYTYVDDTVTFGVQYYYWLEDIDLSSRVDSVSGPVLGR